MYGVLKYTVELDEMRYFEVTDSSDTLGFLLEFSSGEFYNGRFTTESWDLLNYNLGVL